MKTDLKGCAATCQSGEYYEEFETPRGTRIQYDYRLPDGSLFSTVAKTVEDARKKLKEMRK